MSAQSSTDSLLAMAMAFTKIRVRPGYVAQKR